MSNALIAAINRVDAGVMSDGPEDYLYADFINDVYGIPGTSALPVTNLQTRQLSEVWRSNSAAADWNYVQCDFGLAQLIELVGVINHNGTSAGQYRVQLSNDPTFDTTTYDSGLLNLWPSLGGYGQLPWGVFQWGDILTSDAQSFYNPAAYHILPAGQTGRYLRVSFSDPTNTADYFQFARLWAGPVYRPSVNLQYGWKIRWVDPSVVQRSRRGVVYGDEQPRYRLLSFVLDHIDQDEMLPNIFDYLDRRKGTLGDLIVIPQPDRQDLYIHEAIYGRQPQLNDVVNNYNTARTREITVEEYVA